MARYNYKCVNGHCEDNNKLVEISKPMADGGKEEFCEKCKGEMNKVYGSPGINTFGDGYKP